MLVPTVISGRRNPWNKGKLVGQKAPLKLRDIWAIRVRLEIADRKRELALFNLALDSKLRSCDLVQLGVPLILLPKVPVGFVGNYSVSVGIS